MIKKLQRKFISITAAALFIMILLVLTAPSGLKPQKLVYRLDYFTGCRFGLFSYATTTPGGHVDFMDFRYEKKEV